MQTGDFTNPILDQLNQGLYNTLLENYESRIGMLLEKID